ncbi:MAG: hypothetical protein A2068_13685 [Ignavibacteria bacterium GWB2_35_6b]|nr:MAG: hypothetical protein A2068_13685 [Ignavibacteria bacterium GWB2_35_6b]
MEIEKVNKRIGNLIKLKPEYEERYKILHKHTFPCVLDRIRKSNIRNYSIFLLNGILFSYYEYVGKDYISDINSTADETTKDWWKLTDPMQEPLPVRKQGEWWAEMEMLQHFDEIIKPYTAVERHGYTAEIKISDEKIVINLFKEFNESFIPFFKNSFIQNHSVFLKDGKLYVYFEYAGKNFANDDEELNGKEELKKWNAGLEQCLSSSWKEMKEVFHTH